MVRLALPAVALALALTPVSAVACAPEMILSKTGSIRLGIRDLQTIAWVAKEYRAQPRRRVILYAQGDTPRRISANMSLAQRRGEVVRAALVRRGVPRRMIEIRTQRDGGVVEFEFEKAEASCG